jgi:hypothetical protein
LKEERTATEEFLRRPSEMKDIISRAILRRKKQNK